MHGSLTKTGDFLQGFWHTKRCVPVYRNADFYFLIMCDLPAGFMGAWHVKPITKAASVVTVPIRFRLAWLQNHFQIKRGFVYVCD